MTLNSPVKSSSRLDQRQ